MIPVRTFDEADLCNIEVNVKTPLVLKLVEQIRGLQHELAIADNTILEQKEEIDRLMGDD